MPLHPVKETPARAGQPASWGTFDDAIGFHTQYLDSPNAGIGFEFMAGDGLVGIDLDLALDPSGCLYDWARPLVEPFELLGGAYIEVSPSGRGLHIITRATLPRNPNRILFGGIEEGPKKSGVEVYFERRYFTVTGDLWSGPCEIGDNHGAVDALIVATGLSAQVERQTAIATVGSDPSRLPDVQSALGALDPDMDYPEWIAIGMAIKTGLGEVGRDLWIDWSSLGKKFIKGQAEDKWDTFHGSEIQLGSLFKKAQALGWEFPQVAPQDEFAQFISADDFSDLVGATDPIGDGFPVDRGAIPYHQNRKGIIKSAGNISLYFARDPEWAGRLRYNIRRGAELDGEPVDDNGFTKLGTIVERALGLDGAAAIDHVYRGIIAAAKEREYDPIREYITAAPWDGMRRIDEWLIRAGVPDSRATRMISRRFLIGAAGRALYEPQPGREPLEGGQGTKMDYVLVLEGEQGEKKSWVVEALCPPGYFFDSHFDFTHKVADFYQALGANFIVEMAELDTMSRSEVTTVKAVITSRLDSYRAPYGRVQERHPRRSVMTGTTNEREWNRDLTGGRRFWPVAAWDCRLDVAWILENRQQLWAEAVAAYRAGECYWEDAIMKTLLEPLQTARAATPGWVVTLGAFINDPDVARRGYVTPEYLVETFRFLGGVSSAELSKVLRHLGCKMQSPKVGPRNVKVWVLPGGPEDHGALVKLIEANPLSVIDADFKVLS